MGELADRLDGMVVAVASPDGQITATVRGSDRVQVAFRAGAYRSYGDRALERQLTRLATSSWTAHERESRRILRAEIDNLLPDDAIEFGPERRRYRQGLAEITVQAGTDDQCIWIRTRGLVHWEIVLADGTVRWLAEREFLTGLGAVTADLLLQHRIAAIRLTDQIYRLGPPGVRWPRPPWRDR